MCYDTDITPQYLAGYIDADGYIGINKSNTANGSYRYAVYVGITSTNRDVLSLIQKKYGGGLTKNNNGSKKWRPKYSLVWYSHKAKELINIIFNYLVIKKERAKLVLSFPIGQTGVNLSKEENDIREQLYRESKKLNKRGNNCS